ncbi:adenylate/guanylate cyclase domain-containing protein [Bosea sp. 2YAB26]|uniref:adenylate/guanylate cyclase domain-containing protein n=1 Tax=Bosea sp. 2YAB26 TaxID=3237478 RepID=UPI003F922F1D
MDALDRRLLAIVCADVAGYSGLMSADEERTFARVHALFSKVVQPEAQRNQGRIVKTMGDGFLAEFTSAIKAVEFAAGVQQKCAVADREMRFRIGIHVGDVIAQEGDVFGDGVNIAARLQEAAEPGGILVSRAVRDQARDRFQFEEAGEKHLKNIPRPVRTFRVAGVGREPARSRKIRWFVWVVPASVAALFLAVFAALSGWSPFHGASGNLSGQVQHARPSIAVLPFANRSGDAADDYFSDGLTENVLTALARFPDLFVISRNSTFAYKGREEDTAEIGRTLGVRYVLQGSVQKAGQQLRVTAQLIDARGGGNVWAERYDRPLPDIFAIQDEIAERIASRLGSSIQRAEVAAGMRKAPTDLTTYDLYLRGRSLRQVGSKDKALAARAMFEKAIELDPTFAPALAEMAFAYYRGVALRWDTPDREAALEKGLAFAQRALGADPTLPMAHMVMGDLLLRRHAHDEAARWAKRAVELNPNDAEYYAGLANIISFMGRSEEAIALMQRAFVLDPLHSPNYDMYLGRALLLSRRFDEALPYLRDCARRAPDYWPCHLFSAVTDAHMGHNDAAKAALDELRRSSPIRTVQDFLGPGDYLPGPTFDLISEGLAKAGLPPS